MLKFLRPVTRPWVAPETASGVGLCRRRTAYGVDETDADVNYRWTETEGDVSLT